MAAIASDRGAIGSIKTAKAVAKPTAVTANPFIHVAGQSGNPQYSNAPAAAPAAPAPPPPPPPPPPLDFNLLTQADSEYKSGRNLLDRQNDMNISALKFGLARNSQSAQDTANAHGGLFGGAAANAQKSLAAESAQRGLQLALDYDQGGHDLYHSVFNRLTQQLGGGA